MGIKIEENKITIRLDEETCRTYDENLDFMELVAYSVREEAIRKWGTYGDVYVWDILRWLNINYFDCSNIDNKGYHRSNDREHNSVPNIGIRRRYEDFGTDNVKRYIYVTISDFIELEVRPKVKENE